jgi:NDP-sugar pyrophosphorylase family protein
MQAAIIAAGEGSRLRAEGISVPKPLVPVGGVPLIERILRTFIRTGISRAACIINEQSVEVRDYVDGLNLPIAMSWVVKTTPSSMHSLLELAPYLQDDRFLCTTVDPIFPAAEFDSYVGYAAGVPETTDGILAVTRFVDDENPLYVTMADDRRILQFSKTDESPWVTGGLYVFSPAIFREKDIVLAKGMNRLRNFLSHLVSKNYRIEGYPFSTIVDVDHLHDIQVAEKLLNEI